MRVLLDTNVLIAAFVARGLCHELLEHCEREHHMATSERLLEEFRTKLELKFRVPPEKASEVVDLLRVHSEVGQPTALRQPACRDPDDDWVLATAVAGDCRCIITGDQDLLALRGYRQVTILDPRTFWTLQPSPGTPPA